MVNNVDLPYRLGVGIMLVNGSGEVFVGKRIDSTSEAWQMPQGGIDAGEGANIAAIRELEEETSIDNVRIIKESKDWYYYDLPDNLISNVWGGKYKGQKQKWFLMEYLGEDVDVDINTKHAEFCSWKWVDSNSLPDLIVPFKKQLYKDIITEFKSLF